MSEQRETVGKIATDLSQKEPESRSPIDYQREIHKDFERQMHECIDRAKYLYPHVNEFYIVLEVKKEKLLKNVLRNYYYPRLTCPTPNYDQSVWKYTIKEEHLEYIWTIPDKETCMILRDNCLQVTDEEKELLGFVLDFYDGTLDTRCKKLNKEI